MKKISEAIKPLSHHASFESLKEKILSDPEVQEFVLKNQLSTSEVSKSLPKFNQFISERDKFLAQDINYLTKGYQPILKMNEGYADVFYLETKALVEARKQQEIRNRVSLIGLPNDLKLIKSSDIDLEDSNRIQLFEEINAYIKDFERKKSKGLYVFGNFGVGKSYLMGYLANRLSDRYHKQTLILHFPTFALDIKDAIQSKTVKEEVDKIKKSEILIFDDIGAEQSNAWIRDDILQVILQYRMQEQLLTFFTSNFDLEGLEKHFSNTKSGDEVWQAKRVMERITYLAKSLHLEGSNRRHH